MKPPHLQPNILVTGAHRSGSSWTGTVLSKAPRTRYIQEPFNLAMNRANSPIQYWFEYISDNTPFPRQQKVKRYLRSFFSPFHKDNLLRLRSLRTRQDAGRFYYDFKGMGLNRHTVIKDPHALMSAEWLHQTYGWKVVVLIRHPAAFVASLKVKNWGFDFNHYLAQPGLMEQYLSDFAPDIEDYARQPRDIVDQGILLWNTIYTVVAEYQKKYEGDWYFARHEDLSNAPVTEFRRMFAHLGLPLEAKAHNFIIESTQASVKSELKRNAKDNTQTWQQRLMPDEIKRIKTGAEDLWPHYYKADEW